MTTSSLSAGGGNSRPTSSLWRFSTSATSCLAMVRSAHAKKRRQSALMNGMPLKRTSNAANVDCLVFMPRLYGGPILPVYRHLTKWDISGSFYHFEMTAIKYDVWHSSIIWPLFLLQTTGFLWFQSVEHSSIHDFYVLLIHIIRRWNGIQECSQNSVGGNKQVMKNKAGLWINNWSISDRK